MKEQPLVSIIVPIYNVGQYLTKCLDSILAQSYENLEIILIDDGSTDNSGKIMDDYSKRSKKIKPIHQSHKGVASARQRGIMEISGDWVSFVDPDDYVEEKFIQVLYETAILNNADISSCGFDSFSDDKRCVLKKSPVWPKDVLSGREVINDMLRFRYPAYLPLNLFRSDLFTTANIQFPIGREYEDILPKIKLLFYAKRVAFTNEKLYMYRMRNNSITGKAFSKSKYDDLSDAINSVREFLSCTDTTSKFLFIDYYEFSSLMMMLNYLAREKNESVKTQGYWLDVRGRIKEMYKKTKFPTLKLAVLNTIALKMSSNRKIYSMLYMKFRGSKK